MARPWSKVTKLVQAGDAAGLVELLCRTPPFKEERLNQVVEALESLSVTKVLPPMLKAVGHGRVASAELVPRLERLLVNKCRQEGLADLFTLARTDERVRTLVKELTVRLGPSSTLEPLIKMLADRDEELRRWSRGIIRSFDPFLTVPALLERLDGSADMKLGVVETLGLIRDPQALKPLVTLLGKARGPLREQVQKALVHYQTLAIEPLLKVVASEGKSQRKVAIQTLEMLGELPVSTQVKIHLYQGAEDQLRQIGSRAFETLREAIDWKDPRHRFLAAKLLGEMEEERVLPALERPLDDSDPPVRHVALEGLGKLGQTEALPSLLKGLKDSHDEVARTAAMALSKLGQPGLQSLVEALESEDRRVGQRAGKALLNLGSEAVEPLWAAFLGPKPELAEKAAEILGRTPDLDLARRVELFLRQEKPDSLVKLGSQAIPLIVEVLGDPDDQRQGVAITALEKMGAETVGPLVKTLAEDDLRRRRASLQLLANLGQPAFEGLLEALGSTDARIRRDAVRALGLLGEGKALPSLAQALEDPEPRVAREAAQALVRLGAPGIKRLGKTGSRWGVEPLKALLHQGTQLVTETTRALVGAGSPARKVLEEALDHPQSKVRLEAAWALGELREAASASALLKSLADEDAKVRETARNSLAAIGVKALPSLFKGLKSPFWFVRREAALALGGIGDPRAVKPLIERLGDSDSEVQNAAVKALASFKEGAQEALLKDFDQAPQKEQEMRRALLERLGTDDLVAPSSADLSSDSSPVLGDLMEGVAPMEEEVGQPEASGQLGTAQKPMPGADVGDPIDLPTPETTSERSTISHGKTGPGIDTPMERTSEIEIPQAQAPPSEQGSLTKAWEPTSDVSTQLQRLIIAHKEGALTDQEFAKAKEKLLGL